MSETPDSTPPLIDLDAVDRYLAGEAPAEEAAAVRWTLARKPDAQAAVEMLRTMPVVPGARPQSVSAGDADASWARHWTRMFGAPAPSIDEDSVSRRERVVSPSFRGMKGDRPSRWRPVWYGVAGLVAATLLLVVGWMGGVHRPGARTPVSMMTYTTANGQRGTVTLTDGSTVMLNVASRLEVPADYAAGDHTVRLTGEALFTASHHAGTSLTVLAGPTVTRVLGTSFVVRRYGGDTTTTVAVRDGKVAVDRAVVAAGRMIEVGANGVTRAGEADASQFGFAVGVLALRGVTLAQAIPELNRWYDADVRLGNPALGAEPFEGNVTAGSLDNLRELLAVTFDVHVVRDGRVLTLYPR